MPQTSGKPIQCRAKTPHMTHVQTTPPISYAFLLLPGFSTLGFSCALDCLALANHHPSRKQFYKWRLISEDGNPVAAYAANVDALSAKTCTGCFVVDARDVTQHIID